MTTNKISAVTLGALFALTAAAQTPVCNVPVKAPGVYAPSGLEATFQSYLMCPDDPCKGAPIVAAPNSVWYVAMDMGHQTYATFRFLLQFGPNVGGKVSGKYIYLDSINTPLHSVNVLLNGKSTGHSYVPLNVSAPVNGEVDVKLRVVSLTPEAYGVITVGANNRIAGWAMRLQ